MRLPGTRYQEPGWEQVRKLLGQCSLEACAHLQPSAFNGGLAGLSEYVDHTATILHGLASTARFNAAGNSYGESAGELALALLYELQARPADWRALCQALGASPVDAADPAGYRGATAIGGDGQALLRKKFNDMYAALRDRVDADAYQVACGRPCSPNRLYAYRMLDTAYGAISRLFDDWSAHREEIGAILGRPVDAMPIEARRMRSIADCKPEWIERWSAAHERFHGTAGPLHTRSKRFDSLKQNPAAVAAMLSEIGEYQALSAHQASEWLERLADSDDWLGDLERVLDSAPGQHPDRLQALAIDPFQDAPAPWAGDAEPEPFSSPPGYAWAAQPNADQSAWLAGVLGPATPGVQMAVYAKVLGPLDDSYPPDWLDPATGQLPTLQELAVRDGISVPTLRKRRDAAIAALNQAVRQPAAHRQMAGRST